jgi:hypothetical protein
MSIGISVNMGTFRLAILAHVNWHFCEKLGLAKIK